MKLAACMLLCLMVLSVGAIAFNSEAAAVQSSPKILNARLEGKKLIIEGENFNIGAVILINGKKQKTKNDPAEPSNILIAKKGGKKISPESPVALQVKNPGNRPTEVFAFFSGLTITLEDGNKTINLKVGEKFMLLLKKDSYTWTPEFTDPSVIKRVEDASIIPGAQGIFQAEQPGSTLLAATGELPCHKADPPCLAPTLVFEVRFVVQ